MKNEITVNQLQNFNLSSVTEVYRKKASGLVAHAGLLLEFSNGKHAVLHNTPEQGPHLSSFDEFAQNEKVNPKKCFSSGLDLMKSRIINVLTKKKKYRITDNCEHLASEITTGVASSPQLSATLAGTSIGAIYGAIKADNKFFGVLFGGAAAGLLSLQVAKMCKL